MVIKKPLISVVMCTYNGALYIEDQLKSIMNQSIIPAEVIICDDRSTDETVVILKRFEKEYKQIKVIINESQLGFNKNFEKALSLANYDLIAISDQDDIWAIEKLNILASSFAKDSSVVYCNSIRFKDTIPTDLLPSKTYRRVEGTCVKKLFLYNTCSGHAMMIKKKFLKNILPFPSKGFYDWWIAMIACCNGGLSYVNKTLVFQRLHQNNQSIKQRPRDEKSNEYKLELIDQLKTVVDIPGISESDKLLSIRLTNLLLKTLESGFNFQCFYLNMKHSKSFYYKTKKLIKLPSIIKYSYYFSTNHKSMIS